MFSCSTWFQIKHLTEKTYFEKASFCNAKKLTEVTANFVFYTSTTYQSWDCYEQLSELDDESTPDKMDAQQNHFGAEETSI